MTFDQTARLARLGDGDGDDGWRVRARALLWSPGRAALHGLPPMRIDVGEAEMLRDRGVDFAQKARTAGVAVDLTRWPERGDVFQACATFLPTGREAIAILGAFIHARGAAS